jgi:hypothetical protein
MGHLILPGGNTNGYPGFSLLGESSLAITFDDALIDSVLDFLDDRFHESCQLS